MPPSSGRAAFVTGGTGFVGLNMVKELMIRGWDVTALHRRSSELKLLKRFQPKLAAGDLSDPNSLLAAIPAGTDTIFHVAGNTNMWRGGNAQQTKDNVDGTRNVVDAALAKGVRRLVVTSSISAYGTGGRRNQRGDPEPRRQVERQLSKDQVAGAGTGARRHFQGSRSRHHATRRHHGSVRYRDLVPVVRDGSRRQAAGSPAFSVDLYARARSRRRAYRRRGQGAERRRLPARRRKQNHDGIGAGNLRVGRQAGARKRNVHSPAAKHRGRREILRADSPARRRPSPRKWPA